MFVVLCYDVAAKRDARIRKTVMEYLHPIQRSVFEGELTEKNYRLLRDQLQALLDPDTDSVTIFCMNDLSRIRKAEIGISSSESSFL